ncbi:MAG: D-glycero-beta-D-manno-heptose-7-phosphate kinase [Candidatus Omnitrophica bacterium]|nr:D-glycero-beta-D-manno-heptose-7-phosphate kinase [Candidatus Omnitrophota bacterium]
MKTLNLKRIKKIISRFDGAKALVIGDVMLDEFIWGSVSRISPEAPVPVVWVNRESFMPGGASNVANNLATLGAKTSIAGIIGDDQKGRVLVNELEKKGIDTSGLERDKDRPTTIKTRVIANHQQVVRIDKEKLTEISDELLKEVISYIESRIKDVDAVVIEDYGKGLISPRLLKRVVPLARRLKKIITVDPKEEHFSYYKGVTSMTPNRAEAQNAVNFKIKDDATLFKAGRAILKDLDCETVLITLGENGMALFQKGGIKPMHIPTVAQEVFDVSGAGDTVISAFTLSLCCGAAAQEAAHIANCAAGIVVGKVGIAVVTKEELTERIKKEISRM